MGQGRPPGDGRRGVLPHHQPAERQLPGGPGDERRLHPGVPELRPRERLARRGQAGWLRSPP